MWGCAPRWRGWGLRSSERDPPAFAGLGFTARHCHNWPFRVPNAAETASNPRGTPLRITRREFVVSTTALVAAAALMGSAPFAFAQPSQEELMRPGPLP